MPIFRLAKRSNWRSIVLILWSFVRFIPLVTQQELTPMDDYRLYRFGDYMAMHKRVPSAGDMMVRFGKRSV
uniref:Peptidase_S26 domain-containing protein n=1 Tax=Angiostrongylus cantonensis TaxID=6313 RepID=A0A0K0D7S9_ANGCA